MKDLKPFFFENSIVPYLLSYVAPIEIEAIAIFCFVFARNELTDATKRHETIHFQQYLVTLIVGFFIIYLYDFFYAALIERKGFSRDAYMSIRFEREAHENDENPEYLKTRERYSWLNY